jgi:hypothetical protein
MITDFKFLLLDVLQSIAFTFLDFRAKWKKLRNPRPRSFWDL